MCKQYNSFSALKHKSPQDFHVTLIQCIPNATYPCPLHFKTWKNLIPHAGIQNTSRSFHKQVDKSPHKSRDQLWPPTKMSVRKHLRMHCSRKALRKATERPMSINLWITIVKIKVDLFHWKVLKLKCTITKWVA